MNEDILILIESIEELRKGRGLSQKQLINGIVSESSYTRIKKAHREFPIDLLFPLAISLNARVEDIFDIYNRKKINSDLKIYQEYRRVIKAHDVQGAVDLYKRIKELNSENMNLIRIRLLLENYFSEETPHIPKLNLTELRSMIDNVLSTKVYTSYDLQFIADFATLYSTDQLLVLSKKLREIEPNMIDSNNHFFRKYYPICLGNIADILMDKGLSNESKLVLQKLKYIALHIDSIELLIWHKYLGTVLDIYQHKDQKKKERRLRNLADMVNQWETLFPESSYVQGLSKAFQRLTDRRGQPPEPAVHVSPIYILKP